MDAMEAPACRAGGLVVFDRGVRVRVRVNQPT